MGRIGQVESEGVVALRAERATVAGNPLDMEGDEGQRDVMCAAHVTLLQCILPHRGRWTGSDAGACAGDWPGLGGEKEDPRVGWAVRTGRFIRGVRGRLFAVESARYFR